MMADSEESRWGFRNCGLKDFEVTEHGTKWKDGGKCDEDAVCRDGVCQVCEPDAVRCADHLHIETCKKDGSGWKQEECPAKEVCMKDVCRPRLCEPGDVACSNATTLMICNDEGKGWDASDDCPDGTECYQD